MVAERGYNLEVCEHRCMNPYWIMLFWESPVKWYVGLYFIEVDVDSSDFINL